MRKLEVMLEELLFKARWLLAPFYVGLVLALVMLLVKFGQEFLHLIPRFLGESDQALVVAILTLVDMVLVANLLIIIVFTGYENFVSRMDLEHHADRPEWMGKVDFAGLKIKLFGALVAISGIELLKAVLHVEDYTTEQMAWKVGVHLTFVVSGLLFALMDRLSGSNYSKEENQDERKT